MEQADYLPDTLGSVLFWITVHQTLIVGIAATLAAVATIRALNRQYQQLENLERTKSRGVRRSNRAFLPQALADYSKYCRACALELKTLLDAFQSGQLPKVVELPDPPSLAAQSIARAIEYEEDENSRKLASILAHAQMHDARLRSLAEICGVEENERARIVDESSFDTAYFDLVGLNKLVGRAYDYARARDAAIGDLCDAQEAGTSLVVTFRVTDPRIRQYVEEQWPPDFAEYAIDRDADW